MIRKRKVVKNGLKLTRTNRVDPDPSECPWNCRLCIGCKYLVDYKCVGGKKKQKFCSDITPINSQSNYRYIYAEET